MTTRAEVHALVDELTDDALDNAAYALRTIMAPLTPEQEEGIRAGIRSLEEGRTVPLETVMARLDATIDAARVLHARPMEAGPPLAEARVTGWWAIAYREVFGVTVLLSREPAGPTACGVRIIRGRVVGAVGAAPAGALPAVLAWVATLEG